MNVSTEPAKGTNPTLQKSLPSSADVESHRGAHDPWQITMPDVWVQHPYPLLTTMGTAASGAVQVVPRLHMSSSVSSRVVRMGEETREGILWQPSLPDDKWMRIKRSYFTQEGRDARIQTALAALEQATAQYELDNDIIRWIAEGSDVEDI